MQPIPEQIPITARDWAGGGGIGASDSACYAFGSGRSVEKLGAAAGEGTPGPTKNPVVKKK